MRVLHLIPLSILLLASYSTAQVRNIAPVPDQILTIYTGLGLATIVQVPGPIQSAIIGDQSAFRVEYIDRAVTIKPLRSEARTNLYLITDKQRYNLRLITVHQTSADYIVYVENPSIKPQATWKRFSALAEAGKMKLALHRIGHSPEEFALFDIKLTTSEKSSLRIHSEQIWVHQGTNPKIIDGLFISHLELSKSQPITIGLSLARSDLTKGHPVRVTFRGQKDLSFTVPWEALWR